ncbi:MAG: TolC family protein [Bacteroidota bacterium]
MKSIKFILIVFLTGFISLTTQAQRTFTLQECIDLAIQNNLQTKQQGMQTETAKADVLQSKMAALPSLNAQATNNWQTGFNINPSTNTPEENVAFRTNSLGASASMPIFNGLQTTNTSRLRQSDYTASKHDLENARNNLKLNVANNYLRVMQQNETVAAAKEQVQSTAKQLERQQRLYDLGGLNRSRLLQIKAQLSSEELSLITQQNLLESAYLDLWQLIDIAPDTANKVASLNIDKVLVEDEIRTPAAIYTDFEKKSPDVLAAKQRLRSANLQHFVALGGRSPRISLNASLSSFYTTLNTQGIGSPTFINVPVGFVDGTNQVVNTIRPVYGSTETVSFGSQFSKNFGTSIGFTLSLPIFNNWSVNTNVQKANIQMETAKLTERQTQQNLFKNINTAYLNFKNAQQRYVAAQKTFESNKEALDISEKQFELGGLNTADYLASKNAFVKAESDYLQAKYELVFRKKVLDFYSGKPLN